MRTNNSKSQIANWKLILVVISPFSTCNKKSYQIAPGNPITLSISSITMNVYLLSFPRSASNFSCSPFCIEVSTSSTDFLSFTISFTTLVIALLISSFIFSDNLTLYTLLNGQPATIYSIKGTLVMRHDLELYWLCRLWCLFFTATAHNNSAVSIITAIDFIDR